MAFPFESWYSVVLEAERIWQCKKQSICCANWLEKKGENRTSQILDLLAGNQIEEADQMLRSSNLEYRTRAEMESEAQKVVSNLRKSEKLKHAIDNYVDAIHGRWLLFTKLFYQYEVDDILNSSRESGEQQDS